MAYILKIFLIVMFSSVVLTILSSMNLLEINHIEVGIISMIITVFVQALVMFYFIGISRLTHNIYSLLYNSKDLETLFEKIPKDTTPYIKTIKKFAKDTQLYKRQVIPWVMLTLTLGTFALLSGGAYDTGQAQRTTHAGLAYGFCLSLTIGFFRQWYFLGKGNTTLRKTKRLFDIPDHSM